MPKISIVKIRLLKKLQRKRKIDDLKHFPVRTVLSGEQILNDNAE